MTQTARVRIGRVKLKGGAELSILRPKEDERTREILQKLTQSLAQMSIPVGFVFFVWEADNSSLITQGSWEPNRVAQSMLPDWVRTRLLLEIAAKWNEEDDD